MFKIEVKINIKYNLTFFFLIFLKIIWGINGQILCACYYEWRLNSFNYNEIKVLDLY